MKKTLHVLFLGLLLFWSVGVKGQWVTIPDTNFVNWLNAHGFNTCLNGNLMDTTCSLILNTAGVHCDFSNISNLEGIQYFDNLTDLSCVGNQLSLLPPLPTYLQYLSCGLNNLISLPPLPANLIHLDCPDNLLTSLPTLPNTIEVINCYGNQIFYLPVLPGSLLILGCVKNQLTNLPSLPASLRHLYCGFNQLSFLPAIPANLDHLYINNNFFSNLPVLPNTLEQLDCSYNQLTSLPNPLPSLYQLYCSNNLLTSLPTLPNWLYRLNCSDNQLITLPNIPNQLTRIYCSNNQILNLPDLLDSIFVLVIDSNPNLTCFPKYKNIANLYWSNTSISCLPNAGNIGSAFPSITSLPLCQPASGCDFYWNMYGKTYNDGNGNCLKDSSESILKNIPVKLDSVGSSLQLFLTDNRGYYSFETGLGNYEIGIDTTDLPFKVICPANNLYNSALTFADSLDFDLDFGVQCKPGYIDLIAKSITSSAILTPGGQRTLSFKAGDAGSFYGLNCGSGVSGNVQVVLDSLVSYVSPVAGALTPTSINGDTLVWVVNDFSLVNPINDFRIRIVVDTNATLNNTACFHLNIISNAGDNNLSNNSITNCFQIRNSYDPNAKDMYPAGIVDTAEHAFTFTIYFQNTGNAPAENIYVLDTLDGNLNPHTFQYLSSSHDVVTQLLPGNILRFSFPNINLPDSVSNEPESHGYVQFKINRNDSVYQNMTIYNRAYIYFDFNAPIATNYVVAILDIDCNSVSNLVISDSSLCDGELFSAFNSVLYADLIHHTWTLDSVVLSSTGSGIALSGIAPGIHSVTLISSAGNCYDSSFTLFSVNANPLPLLNLSNDTITSLSIYNTYQWYINGSAIPGANQNTLITAQLNWYYLFVTDSNGCSGFSDSVYVFDCKNLISFSISDTIACENEIILASNNSLITGVQNSWFLDSNLFSNNPSISISGLSSGIHTLSLFVDTSNCKVTVAQSFVIEALPKPVFAISNDSLSSVSIYNSYQWLLNNSAIPFAYQNTYVISQNGFYSLQVVDSNGCIGVSDSIYVVATGNSELTETDFSIFPNPANDILHISIPTNNGSNYQVELSDVTGRKLNYIFKDRTSGQQLELTIPLENLSKGIYLLRVNNVVRYFVKGY